MRNFTYTIQELRDKNLIIFETIVGSHAYGTSTVESDKDIRGVFVQPLNDIFKYGYVEQISDEKNDVVFYEVKRFIDLIIDNNPNILELLASPEDCVIYRNPIFKVLEENREKFLTKRVKYTFAGYAIEQIRKARGYNKKMNWEESQMKRKTVLDFCYILDKGRSILFKKWAKIQEQENGYVENDFGLAAIDHARDLYAVYVNLYQEDGMWGIVSDEEKANDVKLTSIPKDSTFVAYLSFNKNGYSSHCKKYKEYQTWLKERNPHRVKMNKAHRKNYDSKNMCHCIRLLDMVIEMLDTGELIVRRPKEHIELLMSIRRGEMEYEDILKMAESKIASLDEKTEKSKLPEKIDHEAINKILLQMRKYYYKLQ
jgi:uncharacterized protein